MNKIIILVLLGCLFSACSSSEKMTKQEIKIPEVNLLEIDYFKESEIDNSPLPIILLSNIRGKVDYPEEARKRSLQGRVIIEFLISTEGKAYITSIKKSVHPILDNQVINAIKETNFEPGTVNGNPVNVLISMPVDFNLSRSSPPNFQ